MGFGKLFYDAGKQVILEAQPDGSRKIVMDQVSEAKAKVILEAKGELIFLNESGSGNLVKSRKNPKTGEAEYFDDDSKTWKPLKKAKESFSPPDLVAAYRSMGLNESQAKLAAGVEEAVVSSSATKLQEAFQALGLSAEVAKLAASSDKIATIEE